MGARLFGGVAGGLTRPVEFVTLEDTPASYAGQSGKSVAVNAGEDGVEFAAAAVSDFINLDDTPVDYTGQTGKGVTVNPGEDGVEFTVIGAASKAGMFGDGSDGDVTIAVDTDLAGVAKQYNNLTINAGKKLYDSTGILIVRVKNTLTLTGNIDQSGLGAAGGAGGAGGSNGGHGSSCTYIVNGGAGGGAVGANVAANNGSLYGGGASGAGDSSGTSGGDAGSGLNTNSGVGVGTEIMGTDHPDGKITVGTIVYGGAGGAGGGCGVSGGPLYASGGAGGAGGGVATVFARTISGAGNIMANGAAGSNGIDGTDCGGGGGGGGAGGYVYVMAMDLGAATFSVTGGAAGTGGADPVNPGGNGAVGNSGLRRIELIS